MNSVVQSLGGIVEASFVTQKRREHIAALREVRERLGAPGATDRVAAITRRFLTDSIPTSTEPS